MPVRIEAFLALERSLVDRLAQSWIQMSKTLLPEVIAALRAKDYARAEELITNIDLEPLVEQNREYMEYVTISLMLFGASRLTPEVQRTALARLGSNEVVEAAVDNLGASLMGFVEDAIRARMMEQVAALSLADETTPLAEGDTELTVKFDPDQPRDESGKWTEGGGASTDSSPKVGYGSFGGYTPDVSAPTEGEFVKEGGTYTHWRQAHSELVKGALQRWKGSPTDMRLQLRDLVEGGSIRLPNSSGGHKIAAAQAAALLWEVRNKGVPNPIPLYRGAPRSSKEGLVGWSEDKKIAARFAKKYGAKVHTLPVGQGSGIRVNDYVGGSFVDEKEWLIDQYREKKYDPDQARDESGKWTGGGGVPGSKGDVPPKAGSVEIPKGMVRLYHQTTEENLASIASEGLTLASAKGIEGPKAVYAGESPFYGKVENIPTVEFFVPADKWSPPFVLQDVPPENMIAVHLPWHEQARYLDNPEDVKRVLGGEFDSLEADPNFKGSDEVKAIAYIRDKYGKKTKEFDPSQARDESGKWTSGGGGALPGKVQEVVQAWSLKGGWEDYQHAARAVVGGMKAEDYVCYDCRGDDAERFEAAKQVIDAINSSPDVKEPLYRGLTQAGYKVGDRFSESLSSWTSKKDLAEQFASGAFSSRRSGNAGQILSLDIATSVNSKGINVSGNLPADASATLREAGEYLTSGEYEVTEIKGNEIRVRRVGPATKSNLKKLVKFDPDQLRDESGKWTEGGGGSSGGKEGGKAPGPAETPEQKTARLGRAEKMGFDTKHTWHHGTFTSFDEFDKEFANTDAYLGNGFYFSSSDSDVEMNYTNPDSPDQSNKIEALVEEKTNEWDEKHPDADAENRRQAHNQISDDTKDAIQESGTIHLKTFLKMEKPLDLTKTTERFEFNFDEEKETESGRGVDAINALDSAADDILNGGSQDKSYQTARGRLLDAMAGNDLTAGEVFEQMKDIEEFSYLEDPDGKTLHGGQMFKEMAERMGYDGIIMDASAAFPAIVPQKGVIHAIVFKPNQVRSVAAEFDPKAAKSGNLMKIEKAFNPDQARDDSGKWTSTGAGAGADIEARADAALEKLDAAPRTDAITEMEDAWRGGVANFGDPRAAFAIQEAEGYEEYKAFLVEKAREEFGDTVPLYRAMRQSQYDEWKAGSDIGPVATTLDPDWADKWSNFAGHKNLDADPMLVVKIPAPPESIIMMGKLEERELVIDANAISFSDLKKVKIERVAKQKAERIVNPFVSFRNEAENQAQAALQLAASLHAVRLSAFGFTAEAEVLGVSEYMISAQLDERVCPICEYMDGKTFRVSDARASLNTILREKNPEALETLQPWPRQDKESLAEFQSLADDELIDKNWHIPPFHPNCRCLLVHTDEVPQITNTPSFLAATGGGDRVSDLAVTAVAEEIEQREAARLGAEQNAITYVMGQADTPSREYGMAYNPTTGDAIKQWQGFSNHIKFIPTDIPLLEGARFIHNHPGGASLSFGDFLWAGWARMESIVAVGTIDASKYVGRAPPIPTAMLKDYANFIDQLERAAQSIQKAVINPLVEAGQMTAQDNYLSFWHIANDVLREVGIMGYSMESKGPAVTMALTKLGATGQLLFLKDRLHTRFVDIVSSLPRDQQNAFLL